MKRREFVSRLGAAAGAAAGVVTAGVPAAAAADAPSMHEAAINPLDKRPRVRRRAWSWDASGRRRLRRCWTISSVTRWSTSTGIRPAGEDDGGGYSVDSLKRLREECEKHGVSLDMVQFPFMSSSLVDRAKRRAIMMGEEPARQKEIDECHEIIKNCAAAGIPAIKYNLSVLGVLRTESTPGRGGSVNSTWKLAAAKEEPPLTRAGVIDADRQLGAHHVFPRARRAGRGGIQGAAGADIRTIRACRRRASAACSACSARSTA